MKAALGLLLIVFLLLGRASGGAAIHVRSTDRDPVFSPDGTTLAFVRYGATPSIMLIGAGGKHLRTLVTDAAASGLAWSPDGSALAYSVSDSDISRVDVATGVTTQLTHDGEFSDWQPSWAPDGPMIAYDKFERCFRCTGVWVMSADGSNQREVAQDDARRPTFSPVSPNELALSLAGNAMPARVIDLGGNILVPGTGAYTAWSPRGAYVTYTLNGLWIENLETKKTRRITKRITERPSWSPDGAVIAGGHRTEVALVRARDGSHFKVLPNSTVEAGTPSWAGRTVAYVHKGWCGVDLAREDGTHIRRLTRAC